MSSSDTQPNRIDSENEPVDRTASALIQLAIQMKASDLFLLSDEKSVAVRMRQLGVLRPIREYSPDYGRRLITHFKAMSGMDIAERNRPHEGRWVVPREGESPVDLRLNTIPTLFGEDLTCRLLDRRRGLLPLAELHLGQRNAGLAFATETSQRFDPGHWAHRQWQDNHAVRLPAVAQ